MEFLPISDSVGIGLERRRPDVQRVCVLPFVRQRAEIHPWQAPGLADRLKSSGGATGGVVLLPVRARHFVRGLPS